ncbi:MAG TPA: ureidoglycolate lyase [Blastocatellia bacterium]|nr:ureidoglycolate lyase [Blastocatellia bacterium]
MPASAAATGLVRERTIREAEKLIRTICLDAQPMTRETFAPFGEIVNERGSVELDIDGGTPSVAMQTVESRPLAFDFLGRHRRTEQVFAPLGYHRSIIAVAAPDASNPDVPDTQKMAAFIVDGSFAFKLHRGTWHTSAFPLGESATFLVIDREGTLDEDYDLRDLKTALGIVVEIRQQDGK